MTDELDRFRKAAEQYCAVVESADALGLHQFLTRIQLSLLEVYGAALRLPDEYEDAADAPDALSHEEAWAVTELVRAKLGENDHYRDVYDPWAKREEAIDFSLAHGLAEVYRALKDVLADDRGAVGVWDWRFAFVHSWGDDAVRALGALFGLLYDPEHAVDPLEAG